jgi:ribonuclease HI
MLPIKCYTDASFHPQTKIAILGWKIDNNPITTKTINNTTNTKAEFLSLIELISTLNGQLNSIIYTDCLGVLSVI